jgi:hypothetical protein
VQFIILQYNVDIIKTEKDVDVWSEEDPIGVKTGEVYISSAFSIKKDEPEVSLLS